MTEKEQFLAGWEREFEKTLKVLRAYPPGKTDLKPHPKCPDAAELAWRMVFEEKFFSEVAATGKVEFGPTPPAPGGMGAIIEEYGKNHPENVAKVRKMTDAEFNATIKFPSGPKKMDDTRRADILWLMMMDTIHHRGQFSIYLRMAEGKVPSIYGPSADEPWM
jgi:uncharacterized damage-inducible protein DinB